MDCLNEGEKKKGLEGKIPLGTVREKKKKKEKNREKVEKSGATKGKKGIERVSKL